MLPLLVASYAFPVWQFVRYPTHHRLHNPEIIYQCAAAFAHKCTGRRHPFTSRCTNGKSRISLSSNAQASKRRAILNAERCIDQLCHTTERCEVPGMHHG